MLPRTRSPSLPIPSLSRLHIFCPSHSVRAVFFRLCSLFSFRPTKISTINVIVLIMISAKNLFFYFVKCVYAALCHGVCVCVFLELFHNIIHAYTYKHTHTRGVIAPDGNKNEHKSVRFKRAVYCVCILVHNLLYVRVGE